MASKYSGCATITRRWSSSRSEVAALAQKSLDAVVEPVRREAGLDGHPGSGSGDADLASGAQHRVNVLGGEAGGVGKAHDCPADDE